MTSFSQELEAYGNFAVGDRVVAYGHGKNSPDTPGTLVGITRMNYPRTVGYFGVVETDEGHKITTAIGLLRKVLPMSEVNCAS